MPKTNRVAALLIPSTAHRATGRMLACLSLIVVILYLATPSLEAGKISRLAVLIVLAILSVAAAFYAIMSVVLIAREKNRDVSEAETVKWQSGSDDYTGIDYSSLPVWRHSVPPYLLFGIGLSLLGLSGLMLATLLSLGGELVQIHGSTGANTLWVISIGLLVLGLGLTILGWRILRRDSRANQGTSFERFVIDNDFQLIRHPQTKAKIRLYEELTSQISPLRISSIMYELSGLYRGKIFHSALVLGSRRSLLPSKRTFYSGVMVYPYDGNSIMKSLQIEEALRPYIDNGWMAKVVDGNLVVITLGSPQDKAGMMKLFKCIDDVYGV